MSNDFINDIIVLIIGITLAYSGFSNGQYPIGIAGVAVLALLLYRKAKGYVILNAFLSIYLFGKQVDYRVMTAKMFMRKFYATYTDHVILCLVTINLFNAR